MLKFDRKNFTAGTIVVKEPYVLNEKVYKQRRDSKGRLFVDLDGEPVMYSENVSRQVEKLYKFTPHDRGKLFTFEDENYVLNAYPHLFEAGND